MFVCLFVKRYLAHILMIRNTIAVRSDDTSTIIAMFQIFSLRLLLREDGANAAIMTTIAPPPTKNSVKMIFSNKSSSSIKIT
jgi:hypothetical protein